MNPNALKKVNAAWPNIRTPTESTEIIAAGDIDAIAVVTPVYTHNELARKALQEGKHVFVEKPFTSTSAQAAELNELAARRISPSWWIIPSSLPGPSERSRN
jgi:predicted dehydrogenase